MLLCASVIISAMGCFILLKLFIYSVLAVTPDEF